MSVSWLERGLLLLAGLFLVTACAGGGGGGSGASAGSAPGPSSLEPTRVTLSQYAASGALQGFSIHTLKPDGAPVHISYYNPAGALLNYTTYEYDTRNRQTRIGFYNATGGLLWYETYGYEGSARAPHYHGFYSANGTLVRYEAYAYDDEGQLSYHGFYDAEANLTRYAFYNYTAFPDRNGTTRIDFYNALGNLIGVEIRQFDAAGQHNRTDFYNANGDLIHYTVSIYADGTLRYVATYTANGDPISYASYGYGNVSPPQARPPAPTANLMMTVDPVPNGDRAQPPEDPPARAPTQDTNAPPARTPPTPAIPDGDDDDLPDVIDNCPIKNNRAQADADADGIGDACEAQPVTDLVAIVDDRITTVNLSWVNPSGSNLTALNLTYQRSDGIGVPIVVVLTEQANLIAGTTVRWQVMGLMVNTTYTFRVGGFDIQHGRITQPLPLASINRTTRPDLDDDGVPNHVDTCPLLPNAESQDNDTDGDGIGDACEAVGITGLTARASGPNTVNLTWTNPADSVLVGLNISYTSPGVAPAGVDITTAVPLGAGVVVRYQVRGLTANRAYTFRVGGVDFRHGQRTQLLPLSPPASATTPPDQDDDGVADAQDNCPAVANAGGQGNDGDMDGIGDACEAESVEDLVAMVIGPNTVNLTWTNPAGSALHAMNISYHPTNDPDDRTAIDITAEVHLGDTGMAVRYQVGRLMNNTAYTFRVGGIDFRHGRRPQPLPTVSVNAQTPPDQDDDGVADGADNCPLVVNAQDDGDGDNIGDACEARAVSGLNVMATNNVTVVALSWTNPAGSALRAMNISYHPTNEPDDRTVIDITAAVVLTANEVIRYQVRDLVASTAYTFRVGGIDFRHGRLNQTLPPASVTMTTLPDMDGDYLADGADNCPLSDNPDQLDMDTDGIGDACEAEGVEDLRVLVGGETVVNLSWTNPADSDLLMLNFIYGPSDDLSTRSTVNITANVDLAAGAVVISRALRVVPDVWYSFTVRGIDARHGVRNQTLPPVSVRFRTRTSRDGDGFADGEDNCIADFNPDQADLNGDTYGDVCGPDRDGDGMRDIQTARQLDAVRRNLGAQYELITDIDLSSYTNWNPIGTYVDRFRGVFDGNGYTIANLTMNRPGVSAGLFAGVDGGTIIRNVTLRISDIQSARTIGNVNHVGGLLGLGPAFQGRSASVRNVAVIVEGDISAFSNGVASAGGIMGAGALDIRNSYVVVMGEIRATGGGSNSEVGGMVGSLDRDTQVFENSYVLVLSGGSIRSTNRDSRAGGLVGYSDADRPSNSYAVINGTIISSGNRNPSLGALIARGSVINSYFTAPRSIRGSGTNRTLQQLKCPTVANATCADAGPTYTGWNSTIWDFGDNETLPDLRSNRRPAYINGLLP